MSWCEQLYVSRRDPGYANLPMHGHQFDVVCNST